MSPLRSAMRNECGQRAAARLLSSLRGGDWRDHHARLREAWPPDTPLRLLGTTPARVAQMLSASGVPARAVRHATRADLRAGTIACVDLRPLAGGLPRLHWVVVEAVEARRVRADGRWHAWERWERAWRCRASPFAMHRRALVVPTCDARETPIPSA